MKRSWFGWSGPKARIKRMIEAAEIISKLWHGDNNDNNNSNDKRILNYDNKEENDT